MNKTNETRRRFMAHFAGIGLSSTLLPGVLWGRMQQEGAQRVSDAMLKDALAVSGMEFSEDDRKTMLQAVNRSLSRFEELRKTKIPNDVSPPFHFSSITPGMEVSRTAQPFHMSAPAVKRPVNLDEVAFWPVTHLAQLIKTRQVTSTELTKMYLARLHKYNARLNCVVTFLDDMGLEQAKQADAEISAGKYKGPLHGIPWGAKDIIAVKGFKTTWGSDAYKDQVIDEDATVVELLRNAGAVLIAKLASGELASGDTWFGGQTKNPWNPAQGSSGSSAGPASATAAGLVGFGIGTETAGSILSPSGRCGVAGLRPTFGRISRYGVMSLSWTQDRMGPLCRYAEDCALVMHVLARPDGRDVSVSDIPFNWNAQLDIRKLRVGYIKDGFDGSNNENARKTLEQLKALGVQPVSMEIPEFPLDVDGHAVESSAFFDELVRTGRTRQMTNPSRASTWVAARTMPAVEYLQLQRGRMMMMMELAKATAGFDVYLATAGGGGGGGTGTRGGARGAAAPEQPTRQSATARHSTFANLACYPGLAVHNGFNPDGTPSTITFFGPPFKEMEILALAKAYQDAAGFHLKHPNLEA